MTTIKSCESSLKPVPGCKYRSVVSKDSSCLSCLSFPPYGCHLFHPKFSNNKFIKCCRIVEPVDFPLPVNFDESVTFFDLHQKEVVFWLDQSLLPSPPLPPAPSTRCLFNLLETLNQGIVLIVLEPFFKLGRIFDLVAPRVGQGGLVPF